MQDYGLDLHEWETRWQELEPMFEEDPYAALPLATDFVQAVVEQRGFATDATPAEETVRAGQSPDVTKALAYAREVSDAVERGSDEISGGDVAAAINGLREIYETIATERPA